ncbi:MAG: hypothetical protein M1308_17920 [Actinobacteria bacterium]|nr:hypothetical protein [Actinomycetota bacterium]
MKKLSNLSEKITLGFSIISILAYFYNFILYIRIDITTINFGLINTLISKTEIYAGISIILIIIFHLSAILTIILNLKAADRESIFLSFIFFISIISMIMVFSDFALIGDIVKEYNAGLSGIGSEFAVLYFSQFAHLLFYCLIIIFIISANRAKRRIVRSDAEVPLKDEAIFINAQYIGIFTAVLGLGILTALSLSTPLWAIKKGIVAVCAMLVIPYASIITYWLVIKIRERVTEWYDEKQFQDVTKAGFISFLSSIAILTIFFIIQNTLSKFPLLSVLWFPLYFFMILLIFSGSILYFSKKAIS